MIVAELALLVFVAFAHLYAIRRLSSFFVQRVERQDKAEEDRRLAVYKMEKATQRSVARSDAAVRELADTARHLYEETRLAHERADALMQDVKKARGG